MRLLIQCRSVVLKLAAQPMSYALLGVTLLFIVAGCATDKEPGYEQILKMTNNVPVQPEAVILREGDVVRISFPGNTALKSDVFHIGRDGKINLDQIGEIVAAGKTVKTLQDELLKKYSDQISVQEVRVTVESSTFSVYVIGAVLRPGKVASDRPITALDAVMEAGGPDFTRSNLKSVRIIRNENGQIEHYQLNLDSIIKGQETQTFYLKPSDIVYVPERFSWL